jgi:hypothetical protein
MKLTTLALFLASVALQGGRAQIIHIFWAPHYTRNLDTGQTTEALYVHPEPEREISVKIEATADGKALPVVEGHVDDVTWEIDAPIRNLNTYHLDRLTIMTVGKEWVTDNPQRELELQP